MIRYITKIVLIILILILIAPVVFSATQWEAVDIYREATTLCIIYKTKCSITTVPSKYATAITKENGRIEISDKMIALMTKDELRGVLFHEVGHVVFKHVEKNIKYYRHCGNKCNDIYMENVRKQRELQADRFATYVMKLTGKKEGLSGALLKVTPPKMINKEWSSHPSTADRIKQIRRIYYNE